MSSTNPTRLDETMGPNEASCPETILKLLTPTQNEHALDWRKRCLANLQRRSRKLQDGDRIKLAQPMKFTDGHEGDEFIVEKRGSYWVAVERVDLALGEHVREDEVLEDLDPLRRPGFVVGFERFEEVDLGFGPVLCA